MTLYSRDSATKYKITIMALGRYPVLDIDEAAFISLKQAKDCLNSALAIEEKYELLLANFAELEKECLNITVEHMLSRNDGYSGFFDIRLLFNRRLVNLLTATRLYIDQIHRHLRDCIPDTIDATSYAKQLFSAQYDEVFEYRFMEALRNYSQHRGLAVHGTTLGSRRTALDETTQFEFTSVFYSLKKDLENDAEFKKKILDEMPAKVDLIQTSRRYVESLNSVHCLIRDLVVSKIDESRQIIENHLVTYRALSDSNAVGIYAIAYSPKESGDDVEDKVLLLLNWDDSRVLLTKKNGKLTNLHKRFVSSNTRQKE